MPTPPPTNANRGNPNVWTTYKGGKMPMTLAEGVTATSPNVMRTSMNQVQFCGDINLPTSATYPLTFATLPERVRPSSAVHLPCAVELTDGTFHLCHVTFNPDGSAVMSLEFIIHDNPVPKTLYLDSIGFDLASSIYASYNRS